MEKNARLIRISCAVMVAKIATKEVEETGYEQPNRVKGGKAGGNARAEEREAQQPTPERL